MAPRLGATSIRTTSAFRCFAAFVSSRHKLVITRNALVLPSRQRGHWIDNSFSSLDSAKSPTNNPMLSLIGAQITQFGTAAGPGIKRLITEAALLVEDALVLCVGDVTPGTCTDPDSSLIANWR